MHQRPDGSMDRRGVVLLVVISLLTLFAVLGLSFVMYANSTAQGARLTREAETGIRPDMEPELLFSLFLGQLLYDVPDDQTGVYSALRGHSLARSMFGLQYELADLSDRQTIAKKNSVPYNGTGRLHVPLPLPGAPDDFQLVNYQLFREDGFRRDPERPGLTVLPPGSDPFQVRLAPFSGGFNAPYTYPDLNNMFLAAVKADGTVMLPSFHRPWTGFGPLDPTNWRWFRNRENLNDPDQPLLKYLVLRPRPADHAKDASGIPLFPAPADLGGDVKNLVGMPGGNDSIWLDLDAPVMRAPDGRKFKALFAPLIIDLDNRVNLNVHGNARGVLLPGRRPFHGSNQGWGPWEVNPSHLAVPIQTGAALTPKQLEWVNLVTGTAAPQQLGRMTQVTATAPPEILGRLYAPIDFDGANEASGGTSDVLRLPGTLPSLPWQAFPAVAPTSGYGNGGPAERIRHPRLANPFATDPLANNYVFPLSNIEALLRYTDTGSPALTSELFRLAPSNFGDQADPESLRRRSLVTTHSCDVDRPGIVPFFWNLSGEYLTMPNGHLTPSGARLPFPRHNLFIPDPWEESDFTWNNLLRPEMRTAPHLGRLQRLDLNRPLPPYPDPNPQTGVIPPERLLDFRVAQTARQIFAQELFERLCRLTGAGDPRVSLREDTAGRWAAFRWLAQLAVNIVDFIDSDEYSTPFLWALPIPLIAASEWVFGTELPRLVINEVYAQCDNDRRGLIPEQLPRAIAHNAVSFWVELLNPLVPDPSLRNGGTALLSHAESPIYRLEIGTNDTSWADLRDNVRGQPQGIRAIVNDLGPPLAAVLPLNPANQYSGPPGDNVGFYVVGADPAALDPSMLLVNPPVPPPTLPTSYRTKELTLRGQAGELAMGPFSLVLRRLASPHLPANDVEFIGIEPNPFYNPYITVDFVKTVRPADGRVWAYSQPEDPMELPRVERREPTPFWNRHSIGRSQPYAAAFTYPQSPRPWPGVLVPDTMPQNSFYQYNVHEGTPGIEPNWPDKPHPNLLTQLPSFDWLVHLDRPLISPMELLHVSACKPHQLTQRFIEDNQGQHKFKHRAPWFEEGLDPADPTRGLRLARFLEFVTTGHLGAGMRTPLAFDGSPITGTEVTAGSGRLMSLQKGLTGPTQSGGTWQILAGSSLLVGEGDTQEVVRVTSVRGNLIFADFLRTHTSPTGQVPVRPLVYSDRIPGKININTIWDKETFFALCDPQTCNEFTTQEVEELFEKLVLKRTPGLAQNQISSVDRPFLGMSIGNAAQPGDRLYPLVYPISGNDRPSLFQNGSGLDDTFFRSPELNEDRSSPRLFQVLGGQKPNFPYFQNQLLHKVYNHMTPRSNVFAVWLTVGFFEVHDDTTRPVKLGRELVNPDGQTIRHRMFAVVDRSVMTANPGPLPGFRLSNPGNPWTNGLVVPYYSIIH